MGVPGQAAEGLHELRPVTDFYQPVHGAAQIHDAEYGRAAHPQDALADELLVAFDFFDEVLLGFIDIDIERLEIRVSGVDLRFQVSASGLEQFAQGGLDLVALVNRQVRIERGHHLVDLRVEVVELVMLVVQLDQPGPHAGCLVAPIVQPLAVCAQVGQIGLLLLQDQPYGIGHAGRVDTFFDAFELGLQVGQLFFQIVDFLGQGGDFRRETVRPILLLRQLGVLVGQRLELGQGGDSRAPRLFGLFHRLEFALFVEQRSAAFGDGFGLADALHVDILPGRDQLGVRFVPGPLVIVGGQLRLYRAAHGGEELAARLDDVQRIGRRRQRREIALDFLEAFLRGARQARQLGTSPLGLGLEFDPLGLQRLERGLGVDQLLLELRERGVLRHQLQRIARRCIQFGFELLQLFGVGLPPRLEFGDLRFPIPGVGELLERPLVEVRDLGLQVLVQIGRFLDALQPLLHAGRCQTGGGILWAGLFGATNSCRGLHREQ